MRILTPILFVLSIHGVSSYQNEHLYRRNAYAAGFRDGLYARGALPIVQPEPDSIYVGKHHARDLYRYHPIHARAKGDPPAYKEAEPKESIKQKEKKLKKAESERKKAEKKANKKHGDPPKYKSPPPDYRSDGSYNLDSDG